MNRIRFVPIFVFITLLFTVSPLDKISAAEKDSPDYQIGPDDVLNIFVWKEADLTRDVTVMADGRISLPLIGRSPFI